MPIARLIIVFGANGFLIKQDKKSRSKVSILPGECRLSQAHKDSFGGARVTSRLVMCKADCIP